MAGDGCRLRLWVDASVLCARAGLGVVGRESAVRVQISLWRSYKLIRPFDKHRISENR